MKGMQELDATERRLSHLSASCDAVASSITGSHSATATLLTRSDQLASELAAVQRKAAVVATFLEHYQLDPADAETLRTSEVDEAFFAALARVRRVQVNCRALLHTHHQRAGLELLDSMAAFQETAYERLCKYASSQHASLHSVMVLVRVGQPVHAKASLRAGVPAAGDAAHHLAAPTASQLMHATFSTCVIGSTNTNTGPACI